jgi:hypothetical protein
VVRLRDAGITLINAEAFRAAVISWCVAWHQQPAASLPDDDVALCRLLGYGRDLRGWQRLRKAGALQGYVKCSDGRLYHPVVAEKATEALTRRTNTTEIVSAKTERQRRWREHLSRLCAQLRDAGVTPPRGASKETLERLLVDAVASTGSQVGTSTVDRVETAIRGEEKRGEERKGIVPSLRSGVPRRGTVDADFARFWAIYPRKDAKIDAQKAWEQARKLASAAEIIGGLERYPFQSDTALQKLPAGWLREGRWQFEAGTRPMTVAAPKQSGDPSSFAVDLGLDLLTPIGKQFPVERIEHDTPKSGTDGTE